MQGAHGQVGKHRQGQCREDHSFAAQPSVQAGGLAGVCSDHVRHGSRVGMEGIHRGETSRRRRRAEMPVCGAQIAMSTRCTPEFMLPGRSVHVAHVARAPTTVHCAHFSTWKIAPTAPTASPCPCAPSVPRCSRQGQSEAAQEKVP